MLVAPVLAILAYLVVKAWPALSLSFLLENPQNYMTAGGIWAPLVGTFFLVLLSLLVAAPVGVLAGVYLNEYARDNWLTRIINLAVVNLAGVPSIVHALFGVGAFVLFAHMGRSLLAASCTLAVMTLPVIITSTREALASVPMSFREACWNLGASRWQTIRTRAAQLDQRHPHRRDPAGFAGRRRDRPHPLHRRRVLHARGRPRLAVVLSLRPGRPLHGPVDAPVHADHPGPRRLRSASSTAPPWCSSAWCWRSTACPSACGSTSARGRSGRPAMDAHIRFRARFGQLRRQAGAARRHAWKSPQKQIFAIIGPANSGKTTLLKCINRTIDFVPSARVSGQVWVGGRDVFQIRNVYALRRRVGMVFPLPVGLPLSVYENVAYAPRRAGMHDRAELDALVETCLRQAMLWDEVKDRLEHAGHASSPAASSSGSPWPAPCRTARKSSASTSSPSPSTR